MDVTDAREAADEVRRTVHEYCRRIDDADLEGFAALFRHGQWFMVDAPGAEPVFAFLQDHLVLHDGRTCSRHEISNLDVDLVDDDTATFRCYVAIWLDLPATTPQLLSHARFSGTFRRIGGSWWWATHTASTTHVGDLGQHLRVPVPS